MRLGLYLLSLLLVSTGCTHHGIPKLPASHGHLSLAMEGLLEEKSLERVMDGMATNGGAGTPDEPSVELEPEQAPAVFDEVVRVLKGTPTQEELKRASADLAAACEAGLHEACAFQREAFVRPERISGGMFVSPHPVELVERGMFALLIFRCQIDAQGQVRDCTVVEGGPLEGTQRALKELQASRYRPATLAGHPLSIPYTFNLRFLPPNAELSQEEELAWARQRVSQNPQSAPAWTTFAMRLALQSPQEPRYPQAVARAHALAPRSWWAATEVAWQQVQAGQYAVALITVRPPLRRERAHPYVLETAAAAYFGLGQCKEALAEQARAVGLLPKEWPQPEQERFQSKLKEIQAACAAPPAAPHVSAALDPR
ncbi:MAG: hypothetical protein EOO71_11160 [Myxococcaceae bacterium]|nr:MAG: hypothetical protein EOO71_11160 [Myxococcaceae bacterium]